MIAIRRFIDVFSPLIFKNLEKEFIRFTEILQEIDLELVENLILILTFDDKLEKMTFSKHV